MAVIDLKRTVETVRWSDEPGSKEYEIDFSDEGMARLREKVGVIGELFGELDDSDEEGKAQLIEEFVVSVAGRECYEDALAYVDVRHEGAAKCNGMMLSLVVALADLVARHLDAGRAERLRRYIGGQDDAI